MDFLKNTVVTEIFEPVTVSSKLGRKFKMSNRDCYGLSFCISGQITYRMNGKEFVSKKDYAVILPKGGSYTLHGDADGLFPLIDFDADGLDIKEFAIIPLQNDKDFVKTYEEIKRDFLAGSYMKVYSKFYALLDMLNARPEEKSSPLAGVLDYLEEHFGDPTLSNGTLARLLGLSEVYFRKLFLSRYGVTPKQYILNLRIQKAKQFLTDTPYTVTTVSEMCGFSSCYSFCRTFKAKTGLTPTQYAVQNKIYKI